MTAERTSTTTQEKPIKQLAAEARQRLRELKEDSPVEKAKTNLEFLAALGQEPQLCAYLETTQKRINICHKSEDVLVVDLQTAFDLNIYLSPQGETRLSSVAGFFLPETKPWADREPIDGSTLQNMWDQNRHRGIIKKFAKMTPDKIIDKISSKIK